jgi:hypothetical protein
MADEQQVKIEYAEITNAPGIPVHQLSGTYARCGFCGQISDELYPCHDWDSDGKILHQRFKGSCCWVEPVAPPAEEA